MKKLISIAILAILASNLIAQDQQPVKVSHAEPLFIDLIRDLGARQGEKEWNAGWVTENQNNYVGHTAFVEYEFAPFNHLGFEVEVPISFYRSLETQSETSTPRNRIEGIKLATQYTMLVSEKHQLSMAAGYIHEFRIHSFQSIEKTKSLLKGNGISPFLVVAKRLGSRVHTLLYTGPVWEIDIHDPDSFYYQLNTSVHYMLPSKHFIGLEVNEEFHHEVYEVMARPQVKVVLAPNCSIGFATGIPVHAEAHGMSFLARVIYEPSRKR